MASTLTRRSVITAGVASAVALGLSACGSSDSDQSSTEVDGVAVDGSITTITIGATPNPHVEMLQWIQDNLAADAGLNLDIVEITDYQTPNSSLADGSLAANFYQTPNFLAQQIEEKGYDFVSVADVHIEPMGIYSASATSIDQIAEGSSITLNNDPANTARGLKLLEAAGLIKLDPGVEMPSDLDIKDNPKNLKIVTVSGEQVATTMSDANVGAVVLNGNYAIDAGLTPSKDALKLEEAQGSPYVNQLVVRTADKDNEALKKLAGLMNSSEFGAWIAERWTDGSVVAAF